ncbi:MAG: hypothetical protein J0M04_21510 [Verrucomicrobia bacterium]|nr:hypothetical protein [Verrucomicrobiota bacterium]
MKPTHWFTIASAITGCAVALGIWVVREGGRPAEARSGKAHEASVSRISPVSNRHLADKNESESAKISRRERSATHAAPAPAPMRVTGQPPKGGQTVVSEAEWFARAAKVEQEANHEVRRLSEALDLTPQQQAGIFGVIARGSDNWLPGMQVGGIPSGDRTGQADTGLSEADQVMAYLDADQQQTLIQEEMDRVAWWEEVLPQLLPPDLPATTEPVEEVKPFDGAETLME